MPPFDHKRSGRASSYSVWKQTSSRQSKVGPATRTSSERDHLPSPRHTIDIFWLSWHLPSSTFPPRQIGPPRLPSSSVRFAAPAIGIAFPAPPLLYSPALH